VIHVDGMEQNRRHSRETNVTREPVKTKWVSEGEYDYAEVTYGELPGEVWGGERKGGIVHRRRVLFIKPMYWMVVDTLTPSDEEEHFYESTFHLDAAEAVVDSKTKAVRTQNSAGANLTILPLGDEGLSVRIISGQEKPFVQGWLPRQHGLTGAEPRPVVYYARKAVGVTHFLYVFAPARANGQGVVSEVKSASMKDAVLAAEFAVKNSAHRFVMLKSGGIELQRGAGESTIRIEA